ncbi:MAG TPA: metal ABC transporter ATP-binding protein [Phycisphaerales bacterium]|nr:metal ABC transporter ATP-binding protein [Phycisphaerales bacterium]
MPGAPANAVPAIDYVGVGFAFPRPVARGAGGAVEALRDITLRVEPGERLGILGPNGAGKTTLMRITLGLLPCQRGTVRIFGRTPEQARRERLIGYVPQRSDAELTFPISVRQAVELGPAGRLTGFARPSSEDRARVQESMSLLGIADLAERPVGKLSGGQLQRTLIARALAVGARVLLLDEPTVGIDVTGQRRFAELLSSLRDRLGVTIVVVSHDLRTIAAASDRVACLSRTLHSHVAPEGLTPAVLAEVFRHDVEGVFGEVHVDAHPAAGCDEPAHHHHHHEHGHAKGGGGG